MNRLVLAVILTLFSLKLLAQDNRSNQPGSEVLLRVDTVRISPNLEKMIFKYFRTDDEYVYNDGKASGRFEVYHLGSSVPFERDTVYAIRMVSYEDANFDKILDIRIETQVGMSGDNNSTCYYFYNPKLRLFEYGIGDLSNPSVDKTDSTITSSGYCCMGTSGSGQVLKLMNGIFKVIKESAYSRERSYEKILIGDSLVVTTLSRSTPIDGLDGKISVDSTWQYLFGRLRLTSVYRKVAVYAIQKDSLKEAGQFEQDVMGAYVYKSEELFEYSKTSKGKLVCAYTLNKASKNKLVLAKARKFTVKD